MSSMCHFVCLSLVVSVEIGLSLCGGQLKPTDSTRAYNLVLNYCSPLSLSSSHTICVTVSQCMLVKKCVKCVCAFVTCHPVPHGELRSHTVKETLPRGRLPIPNQLTVSAAGNPPVHKEARYDTTALQAREGARDGIDMASTVVLGKSLRGCD